MDNAPQRWVRGRGLERLLAHEPNISDFIQLLSDRDPSPWENVVGFVPESVVREAGKSKNNADLLLTAGSRAAIVEVKLGHMMSAAQQERYESIAGDPDLYLAALAVDADQAASDSGRWQFRSLHKIFDAWKSSSRDELTRHLAADAACIIKSWDDAIASTFSEHESAGSSPVGELDQKFLARAVARRIAQMLRDDHGRLAGAGVTSGGGLSVIQAWTPIRDEANDRCFIAEIRWRETGVDGELRFGVDFEPRPGRKEDEEVRRAAYELARSMDGAIHTDAFVAHLRGEKPKLADLLRRGTHTRPATRGDWEQVLLHGFAGAPLPGEARNNRARTSPDFYGDGALRHEAITKVDFQRASARDLVALLQAALSFLSNQQPATS